MRCTQNPTLQNNKPDVIKLLRNKSPVIYISFYIENIYKRSIYMFYKCLEILVMQIDIKNKSILFNGYISSQFAAGSFAL